MKLLLIGKFPPMQGGVSTQTYWTVRTLAERGHEIDVVTNASEAPFGLRAFVDHDFDDHRSGGAASGRLRVHGTHELAPYSYLPWANPFASKLFGRSLAVMDSQHCDAIVGWYFEPYGLIAAQVSNILGKPLILRHAGSDLGRLANHQDLAVSYQWMLRQASTVVTGGRLSAGRTRLESVGPPGMSLVSVRRSRIPPEFSPKAEPLDIAELLKRLPAWYGQYPLDKGLMNQVNDVNDKEFDATLPTVGVYGKVGSVKGTYDLLGALSKLASRNMAFNLLAVICGTPNRLRELFEAVVAENGLARRTFLLPPLPPWWVPGFLRLCDIACALERKFPIPFHGPSLPREILATGTCLAVSRELADKYMEPDNLVDLKNCAIVEDPRDLDALASRLDLLLSDRVRTAVIGKHGLYLSRAMEQPHDDPMSDVIEGWIAKQTGADGPIRR